MIVALRALHAKAKAGSLDPTEQEDYDRARRQLMSIAFAGQASAYAGAPRRTTMRIALALKVEITFGDSPPQVATTVDVSHDGFSALVAFAAGTGAAARFAIRVAGIEPIAGTCRIASVIKQGALQRVSFAFETIDAAARERLELAIFDYLLKSLP